MSSVKIQGSATGTAAFTIAVPDGTSTDRTINLPDAAGSFVTKDANNNIAGIASINGGQLGGDRNIVVNGMFAVSQRGDFTSASSASNSTYYVDRWIAVVTTVTANKQHLLNTTYGNAFLLTATSTGTGRLGIVQRLETQPYMLNTTVTLSCWVKSNNANARLYIYNDVDGMNTSTPHTGDGTWQKLTMSLALTSGWTDFEVSSRIMSSTNTNVSITSGDYIQTAQVQLEVGSTPTVFQNELYSTTLQKCQRYFVRHTSGSNGLVGPALYEQSNVAVAACEFPTEMRAAPTLTASSGTNYYNLYPSNDAFNSLSIAIPNTKRSLVFNSSEVSGTVGYATTMRTNGSGVTVDFDAEL